MGRWKKKEGKKKTREEKKASIKLERKGKCCTEREDI